MVKISSMSSSQVERVYTACGHLYRNKKALAEVIFEVIFLQSLHIKAEGH